MRKMLFAAVALGGLFGLTSVNASAAPVVAQVHIAPQAQLVQADYHHHYRHRRFSHGHWHYWD
jgi:hypothetical protein